MSNLYWNVYRNLEREIIALADAIHIDDKQINTYSMKIADLLMRTASEVESISKDLYRKNDGPESTTGKHLYFDSDCINFLNQKWNLEKKKVFLSSPFFLSQRQRLFGNDPTYGRRKEKIKPVAQCVSSSKTRPCNMLSGRVYKKSFASNGRFVHSEYLLQRQFFFTPNKFNRRF